MPEQKAPAKKPTAAKTVKTVEAGGKTCRAPKCKQPVRAKGYCRKHYIGWRREKVGSKFRYKISPVGYIFWARSSPASFGTAFSGRWARTSASGRPCGRSISDTWESTCPAKRWSSFCGPV